MKSHIAGIKIYDGEGNLKEEISPLQATILHAKNYETSESFKRLFHRTNWDDLELPNNDGEFSFNRKPPQSYEKIAQLRPSP
tara:strand:+ start:7302 stop:7547 length:246 start_codon:yes stop_codon:yes gene_type:complete